MKQNILVISHRRSGTHLLIDTLVNNFAIGSSTKLNYRSLDFLCKNAHNSKLVGEFGSNLDMGNAIIIKAHSERNFKAFYRVNSEVMELVETVFDTSKIIYLYREPKDVLVSLYNYLHSDVRAIDYSISEFIKSINTYHSSSYGGNKSYVDYWAYHVNGWAEAQVLFVSYEEIMQNYENVILKLRDYLGVTLLPEPVDIRGKFKDEEGVKLTALKPWKGKIGNFQQWLSDKDIKFVDDGTLEAYMQIQDKAFKQASY